jgi:hypothetical protein
VGKDKTSVNNTRAHNEPSRTQKDCCGTACSLGEVEGAAKEGGVKVLPSEQKGREREFVPFSFYCGELVVLPVHDGQAADLVGRATASEECERYLRIPPVLPGSRDAESHFVRRMDARARSKSPSNRETSASASGLNVIDLERARY